MVRHTGTGQRSTKTLCRARHHDCASRIKAVGTVVFLIASVCVSVPGSPLRAESASASTGFGASEGVSGGSETDGVDVIDSSGAVVASPGGPTGSQTSAVAPSSQPSRRAPLSPAVSGAQVVSPSGDTLTITQINISDYNTKVHATLCNDEVIYGGKDYIPCGRINLYDATRGMAESSPNNHSEHTIWDACGNVASTGYVSGWRDTYTGQMENMWTDTGQRSVTPTPTTCFGEWTIEYRFTQTFDSGDTLTATSTRSFEVYPTHSAVVAAGLVQDTPTGGAVQPAEQAGAGGCASPSTQAQATDNPVNTATGNFWHTFDDLAVPGRGPALSSSRTYNSMFADQDSPFGYGWSDTWGMSLTVTGTDAVVRYGNCSEVQFSWDGSTWTAPPRIQAHLVDNGDGTWTHTVRDRTFYDFDATGRLIAKRDLNGYATTVTYPDASTRVVTDEAGRSLTFNLTNGHVTSIADSSMPPRTVSFAYDPAGDLTEAHDVADGIWTFTYDTAHRMLTMRSPRFHDDTTTTPAPEVTNHYDTQGRIDWQSDPLGRATTFDYSTPGTTAVTDPSGDRTDTPTRTGCCCPRPIGMATTPPRDTTATTPTPPSDHRHRPAGAKRRTRSTPTATCSRPPTRGRRPRRSPTTASDRSPRSPMPAPSEVNPSPEPSTTTRPATC